MIFYHDGEDYRAYINKQIPAKNVALVVHEWERFKYVHSDYKKVAKRNYNELLREGKING